MNICKECAEEIGTHKELIIYTPNGDRYSVDTRGRIKNKHLVGHSDAWIMVGIYPTHPFMRNWKHLIPFEDLTPEKVRELEFK